MKIIWSLSSIPEFTGLSRKERSTAWRQAFDQVRRNGFWRYALIAGAVVAILMSIGFLVINWRMPFLSSSIVTVIVIGAISGHVAGVLINSLVYRNHRGLFANAGNWETEQDPSLNEDDREEFGRQDS